MSATSAVGSSSEPRYERIRVRRIAGALGAEIDGVDLVGDLDAGLVAEIRRAFLANGVIFFRDQALSPARFLEFAGRFGEVIEYPFAA